MEKHTHTRSTTPEEHSHRPDTYHGPDGDYIFLKLLSLGSAHTVATPTRDGRSRRRLTRRGDRGRGGRNGAAGGAGGARDAAAANPAGAGHGDH